MSSRGDEVPRAAPRGAPAAPRDVPPVASLDNLVGVHPDALRRLYAAGRPADPDELGAAPRGLFLSSDAVESVFMLARPAMKVLFGSANPWQGKRFDQGGHGGQNVVLGKRVFRFRAEPEASRLDGQPTLVLRYDAPSFKNPWPVRALVDELRLVAPGIAIGPAFLPSVMRDRALLWWGLEATPPS